MSETKCYGCGASTSNGLALCDLCQMKAAKCLEFLPVYFRNLARWRPGRAGSRPVPGSRAPATIGASDSRGDHVSDALDHVGNEISTWARKLNDDRGVELPMQGDEAETVAALCRLFAGHMTSIATLEWCGVFLVEMSEHEDALRRLTERVAPGWYAGACRHCSVPTHVIPGLTWVTCGGCGATTYARDHLDVIRDEARDWVARPRALADAIVCLVDTEPSGVRLHDRIRQWDRRLKLTGIRATDDEGDEVGPKRYRFGDVLDLLNIEGQTRTADKQERAS